MKFLFLPLPWTSKSLILVTKWKVLIALSGGTFLAHCNHWPEKSSTHSEVKYVFTVSIQDAFLASGFSLADYICQVLVTSLWSIFSFRLNANAVMFIWAAVLHSSAIARSSVQLLIPLSRMSSTKSRLVKLFHFFATAQEDSPSLDFIFVAQAARNPAIDFLVFEEAPATSLVDGFHSEEALGYFYKHTCMQTDRNYACH